MHYKIIEINMKGEEKALSVHGSEEEAREVFKNVLGIPWADGHYLEESEIDPDVIKIMRWSLLVGVIMLVPVGDGSGE